MFLVVDVATNSFGLKISVVREVEIRDIESNSIIAKSRNVKYVRDFLYPLLMVNTIILMATTIQTMIDTRFAGTSPQSGAVPSSDGRKPARKLLCI